MVIFKKNFTGIKKIDLVINLAAQVKVRFSKYKPEEYIKSVSLDF